VGTPGKRNGDIELSFIENVSREIASALKDKQAFHVIAVRSTVFPGTTQNRILPILESISGKKNTVDFGVVYNPEFLREGSGIKDFLDPPFTVIGQIDEKSAQIVASLYKEFANPLIHTDIKTAEMVKYVSNSFHALKIIFANEIGALSKSLGVDSHKVIDIFMQDKKLNISTAYLRPAFAFGGSCLSKDVQALCYNTKQRDVEVPVMSHLLRSNTCHLQRVLDLIEDTGKKRIGLLGLSFKENTDDLRESPLVHLIANLIGRGYELKVFDSNVNLSFLVGANKKYIEEKIPHIASLMTSTIEDTLELSDVIIVGNRSEEYKGIRSRTRDDQVLLDLVRMDKDLVSGDNYIGICW
jgi:GDP-mannose 6-dehydrogenase